jgi:hypothetical protein
MRTSLWRGLGFRPWVGLIVTVLAVPVIVLLNWLVLGVGAGVLFGHQFRGEDLLELSRLAVFGAPLAWALGGFAVALIALPVMYLLGPRFQYESSHLVLVGALTGAVLGLLLAIPGHDGDSIAFSVLPVVGYCGLVGAQCGAVFWFVGIRGERAHLGRPRA